MKHIPIHTLFAAKLAGIAGDAVEDVGAAQFLKMAAPTIPQKHQTEVAELLGAEIERLKAAEETPARKLVLSLLAKAIDTVTHLEYEAAGRAPAAAKCS